MTHSTIGWSPEGRFFAYERAAILDGSGLPHCEVSIVDSDFAELAAGPFKATAKDPGDESEGACALARSAAKPALDARRVDPALAGRPLKLSPLAATLIDSGARAGGRTSRVEFRDRGRACNLELSETPVRSPNPEWQLFSWDLGLSCAGSRRTLRCAGCGSELAVVANADIVDVVAYEGRIAVFVEGSTHGFEGLDVTPTVVAARLPGTPLGPAAPGSRYALEVLGFSEDSSKFGYWLSGVDGSSSQARAELRVLAVANGSEVLAGSEWEGSGDAGEKLARLKDRERPRLAALGLPSDPGDEMYKSGSATKTRFVLPGRGEHELRLRSAPWGGETNEEVRLSLVRPGGGEQVIFTRRGGYAYSINSVRVSRGGKALAVALKFTRKDAVGEHREFAVAVATFEGAGRAATQGGDAGIRR